MSTTDSNCRHRRRSVGQIHSSQFDLVVCANRFRLRCYQSEWETKSEKQGTNSIHAALSKMTNDCFRGIVGSRITAPQIPWLLTHHQETILTQFVMALQSISNMFVTFSFIVLHFLLLIWLCLSYLLKSKLELLLLRKWVLNWQMLVPQFRKLPILKNPLDLLSRTVVTTVNRRAIGSMCVHLGLKKRTLYQSWQSKRTSRRGFQSTSSFCPANLLACLLHTTFTAESKHSQGHPSLDSEYDWWKNATNVPWLSKFSVLAICCIFCYDSYWILR